jgi:serine/threonine-protein kinase
VTSKSDDNEASENASGVPSSFPGGPRPGAVLASKYRVETVLGSGGMGIVVAATHLQLGDPFAIKLLRPETSSRVDSVGRFLREARIAMRLRGEHVVRVYEVGTLDDGSPFIAMERLAGRDLRAVLRDEGRIAQTVAVDYVLQACEAIAEAHALGVIHRDLKPANIFLTERIDGTPCVKVLDFGVSKIGVDFASAAGGLSSGASMDLPAGADEASLELADTARPATGITRTRALLGSPRYMAPEQLRSPRDVDVRADVWALGAILFELLTGNPPFDGESLEEVRSMIVGAPAPVVPGIPRELEWVVHRCLAKDPAQRFAAVRDLAEALAPFASEEGRGIAERIRRLPRGPRSSGEVTAAQRSPARLDTTGTTAEATADGGGRRSIRIASGVTGAAVLALAIGWKLTFGRAAPPPSWTPLDAGIVEGPVPPLSAPIAEEPRAQPSAVEPPRPIPSAAPSSSAAPPPQKGRAQAHSAPAAASAPTPAPASEAIAAPDPLRLDAGSLFDEQK